MVDALGELEEPGDRVALEAQHPVRVVLEHHGAGLGGEVQEAPPIRERERPPARVLEGRDRVDDVALAERAGERVDVEAVVRELHLLDLGAQLAQDRERAVVAGRLDEEARAALDEVARREREALEGPVRDDHARGIDAVLLGNPLLEGRVAARRPVLERRCPVALECLARAVAEGRDRKEIRARHSACEGDRRHESSLARRAGAVRRGRRRARRRAGRPPSGSSRRGRRRPRAPPSWPARCRRCPR